MRVMVRTAGVIALLAGSLVWPSGVAQAAAPVASEAVPAGGCPQKPERLGGCFIDGQRLFLKSKKSVGTADVAVGSQYRLSATSRDFTEVLTVRIEDVSGIAAGAKLGLSVACSGTCKAEGKFPSIIISKGATARATITYHDTTKSKNSTRVRHLLTGRKSGYPEANASWNSSEIRCDNQLLKSGKSAGCVFPQVVPTLTKMKELPVSRRT
ncbi:hypothetical protein [Streptomyces lasiicapitis]|uniref:hypothetical protein n=1 Tax=Streptomyces lasiicapitis TaxID=1923961 RepID=UPI003658438D